MCEAVSEGWGPAVGYAGLSLEAGGQLVDVRCFCEGWGPAGGCAVLSLEAGGQLVDVRGS